MPNRPIRPSEEAREILALGLKDFADTRDAIIKDHLFGSWDPKADTGASAANNLIRATLARWDAAKTDEQRSEVANRIITDVRAVHELEGAPALPAWVQRFEGRGLQQQRLGPRNKARPREVVDPTIEQAATHALEQLGRRLDKAEKNLAAAAKGIVVPLAIGGVVLVTVVGGIVLLGGRR